MNELSLFSGAGGGLLASRLLGWRCVGYVEWDAYCQAVIKARQADGLLDVVPIFGDVREFVRSGAAQEYRGVADVVSGGFPCQPFSVAGKRAGTADDRNMWPAFAEVVGAVRPRYVFAENVPGLLTWNGGSYFGRIVGDLAALGYGVRWTVLGADDVGAPHRRKRLWILAISNTESRAGKFQQGQREGLPDEFAKYGSSGDVADAARDVRPEQAAGGAEWERVRECGEPCDVADTIGGRRDGGPYEPVGGSQGRAAVESGGEVGWWSTDPADLPDAAGEECTRLSCGAGETHTSTGCGCTRSTQSRVGRVAHGVAYRVDRLRALGNGQLPAVAATAWRLLNGPAQLDVSR